MVVGVRKTLEEGRTYTSEDLSRRFGLSGPDFERVLDHLMEQGCLTPVLYERRWAGGAGQVAVCAPREHLIRWRA